LEAALKKLIMLSATTGPTPSMAVSSSRVADSIFAMNRRPFQALCPCVHQRCECRVRTENAPGWCSYWRRWLRLGFERNFAPMRSISSQLFLLKKIEISDVFNQTIIDQLLD
jgi:hypothetical protein